MIRVIFRYIGGSQPGDMRTVSPKELFQVAGYSGCYLLADDLDLDEERVFRLDRIDWEQAPGRGEWARGRSDGDFRRPALTAGARSRKIRPFSGRDG